MAKNVQCESPSLILHAISKLITFSAWPMGVMIESEQSVTRFLERSHQATAGVDQMLRKGEFIGN